jgi:hypothetical protein
VTRFLAALTIALVALYAPAASAAQLVYVEWTSSAIGKKVPLRRVDILGHWPVDLGRVNRPSYTPVFILVDEGREVGRFDGYTTPQGFKRDLQRLLQRSH